jgi:hypothetical protein
MSYNNQYYYYDDEDETGLLEKPNLDTTLDTLKAGEKSRPDAAMFYGLSDLNANEIERVRGVWNGLLPAYRRKVMRQIAETAETNFDLDYGAMGRLGLEDSDAEVRIHAIDALSEDRSTDLMALLIERLRTDDTTEVRAAAASALGEFILSGELGDLPETITTQAQQAVIAVLNNAQEPIEVRRRALEALSNCSHSMIQGAIRDAYQHSDRRMRVSALYAMGRSCDAVWSDTVMAELRSEDSEMRFEAARAAGELELRQAVLHLTPLTRDTDSEIREIAIWSLGEIGGEDALKVLRKLARDAERAKQGELLQLIEDAILTASMGGDELPIM